MAYASRFNGFEVPRTHLVGEPILVERSQLVARPALMALPTRA
jgi:hypothetical protein